MFLCKECHKEGGCDSEHMGFRIRGACEHCRQVADCYDCHNYDFRKPKQAEISNAND